MTPLLHSPVERPEESDYLQLEIPALPEQVSHVRHAVAGFLHKLAWGKSDAEELLLAVGEACSNAVSYGGHGLADARVNIICLPLDSHRLQVDVQNQGNGFHPDLAVLGRLPEADQLTTHGRGFGLMLALVDQVQILSDGANTIVRLTKSKTP